MIKVVRKIAPIFNDSPRGKLSPWELRRFKWMDGSRGYSGIRTIIASKRRVGDNEPFISNKTVEEYRQKMGTPEGDIIEPTGPRRIEK